MSPLSAEDASTRIPCWLARAARRRRARCGTVPALPPKSSCRSDRHQQGGQKAGLCSYVHSRTAATTFPKGKSSLTPRKGRVLTYVNPGFIFISRPPGPCHSMRPPRLPYARSPLRRGRHAGHVRRRREGTRGSTQGGSKETTRAPKAVTRTHQRCVNPERCPSSLRARACRSFPAPQAIHRMRSGRYGR